MSCDEAQKKAADLQAGDPEKGWLRELMLAEKPASAQCRLLTAHARNSQAIRGIRLEGAAAGMLQSSLQG